MPTGFTAELYDGEQAFEEFVMRCARNFVVTMRDAPMDSEIPDVFEPSAFYEDEVRRAINRKQWLDELSPEQISMEAIKEFLAARERIERSEIERKERRARYLAMLSKVQKWSPPTPDHYGLRTFMIEQLETSIDHDCRDYGERGPRQESPSAWHARQIAEAASRIDRARRDLDEERERCEARTAWVRALRLSLIGRKEDGDDAGTSG